MKHLLYFNPVTVTQSSNLHLAGMERFSSFFKIFKSAGAPIDRTGTIVLPVRTASLFPVPAFHAFSKSYEDICNDRAIELLARAQSLGVDLCAFWSGGIDSTLVLVSLLKNATPDQRDRIVVLMSEESIVENPNFYRDHIRGKLKHDSSMLFSVLLGTDRLFVNGEHNDQLFGAELSGQLMKRFGDSVIHQPYAHETFVTFFFEKIGDPAIATFYVEMFERLSAAAPMDLPSNHDVIWWFNFAAHWQSVFTRTLSYVSQRNSRDLTEEYVAAHYAPFYNTEEFQLWSMNNLDKRIKDTWKSYKWPCKDIIYAYTKDADYRDNKTKRGSLFLLLNQQTPFNFIDDRYGFSYEMDPTEYHEPENDFI